MTTTTTPTIRGSRSEGATRLYAIYVEAETRAQAAVILHEQVGGSLADLAELMSETGLEADWRDDPEYDVNEWEPAR